jgi:hypothetical protein
MLSWLVCTGRHQSQKGADESNILSFTLFYSTILMSMLLVCLFLIIVTLTTEQYYIKFASNPVMYCYKYIKNVLTDALKVNSFLITS